MFWPLLFVSNESFKIEFQQDIFQVPDTHLEQNRKKIDPMVQWTNVFQFSLANSNITNPLGLAIILQAENGEDYFCLSTRIPNF